jgi:hypothetical protein
VARPLAVVVGLTSVLWAIAWVLLRDVRKAALVTSAFLLLTFAHPTFLAGAARVLGVSTASRSALAPLEEKLVLAITVLWLVVVALVARIRLGLDPATRWLNLIAAIWVALPLSMIVLHWRGTGPVELPSVSASGGGLRTRPHIFYVVLDAYGRQDVLQDRYGQDNAPFLDGLRERGFYVAARSHSNYAQTSLSLASALNMAYLDVLADRPDGRSLDRRPLTQLIDRNRIVAFLKQRGYEFVSFASGAAITELKAPDSVLSPPRFLTEFENVLISSTALPAWIRLVRRLPGGEAIPDQFDLHRERVRWVLEHLPEQAASIQPRFVFAHILCPHPPFVFEGDGSRPPALASGPLDVFLDGINSGPRQAYASGYRKQVAFLNGLLLRTIDAIRARAAAPPVIIIQGDHGPGLRWYPDDPERTDMEERFPILNAYLFPDRDYRSLYDRITPVNSFRVVLAQYFGGDLPVLEDRSYFSTWTVPYGFIDVSGRLD